MNKLNFRPRQTGKTELLLTRYNEEHNKGNVPLFISHTLKSVKRIKNIYGYPYPYKNIYSMGEVLTKDGKILKEIKPDILLIDEFFYDLKTRAKFIDLINSLKLSWECNTTARKFYNEQMVNTIRMGKIESKRNPKFNIAEYMLMIERFYEEEVADICWDLISDPDVEITFAHHPLLTHYRGMSKDQFEIEMLGVVTK